MIYYRAFDELDRTYTQDNQLVSSFYFSIVTFTTLGYGDILPITDRLKLICASEALFGAFLMGMVVAGFSNKSRY